MRDPPSNTTTLPRSCRKAERLCRKDVFVEKTWMRRSRCLCGKDTDVFVEKTQTSLWKRHRCLCGKDTDDSSAVTDKSTKCSSEHKIALQKRPDDVDGTQMIASPSKTSDEAKLPYCGSGSTFQKRRLPDRTVEPECTRVCVPRVLLSVVSYGVITRSIRRRACR
jgi:hypothetical protein